jgi:hypothetical protein
VGLKVFGESTFGLELFGECLQIIDRGVLLQILLVSLLRSLFKSLSTLLASINREGVPGSGVRIFVFSDIRVRMSGVDRSDLGLMERV